MGQVETVTAQAAPAEASDSAPPNVGTEQADNAWAESLRDVMRQVIASLPDHATLGELVLAARSNPAMTPVLGIFTVQELIDTAKKKPKPRPKPKNGHDEEIQFDADGNPILDLDTGPAVIRRRADVPDGDVRVLRCLADRGPQRESDLVSHTNLTGEQLRIIIRHLRTKGYIHIEGSGAKRRLKVTRNGSGFLRKHKR
jgi:predicted transcriptional regulator